MLRRSISFLLQHNHFSILELLRLFAKELYIIDCFQYTDMLEAILIFRYLQPIVMINPWLVSKLQDLLHIVSIQKLLEVLRNIHLALHFEPVAKSNQKF